MGTPRIFTTRQLKTGLELDLDAAPVHHLTRVLRLAAGSELALFNGDGHEYRSRLTQVSRGAARVEVLGCSPMEPPPSLPIHLGIAVSKGDRMDIAVQKAVELGVTEISPLITEHCVVRLSPERMAKRLEHWQGILVSACGQCGRNRLPKLHGTRSLESWLATAGETVRLFLDPRSSRSLAETVKPAGGVRLLVGPEGGLSDAECVAAAAAGFTGVRLGPRILRTETAPLAAIAAMQVLWGDFR